jgi:HK97 family phage major capsid protein
VRVLTERYAESDQVGVVLIDRVGGCLVNPDAVRIDVV